MNCEYRKGVGIFLLNKENKLWVGKRIDFKSNFWQMPQGGIDKNETPIDNIKVIKPDFFAILSITFLLIPLSLGVEDLYWRYLK